MNDRARDGRRRRKRIGRSYAKSETTCGRRERIARSFDNNALRVEKKNELGIGLIDVIACFFNEA